MATLRVEHRRQGWAVGVLAEKDDSYRDQLTSQLWLAFDQLASRPG